MRGRRAREVVMILGLTAIWVLLNGELSPANVVAGLLVAGGIRLAVPLAAAPNHHRVHPVAAIRFAAFVLWNLLTSSIVVVMASLFPRDDRLRSGLVRVDLPGATPLVATLVSHAITLTPGTLTVTAETDGDGAVLHVHVMGLADLDDFRAEIADLHVRATAAVTPVPVTPAGSAAP